MNENFVVDVLHLDYLRMHRKVLDEKIQDLQNKIVRHMEAEGLSQIRVTDRQVTLIKPTREFVDEVSLKEAVDQNIWEAVSRRVYDKRKAEIACEEGVVSIMLLNKFIHKRPCEPYIKIGR